MIVAGSPFADGMDVDQNLHLGDRVAVATGVEDREVIDRADGAGPAHHLVSDLSLEGGHVSHRPGPLESS